MLHNMRQPKFKMLEKDDNVAIAIYMLYFFTTWLKVP